MDEQAARTFWELSLAHPIDDGQPQDEYIGDYHVLFATMEHKSGGEPRPSYEVHDENHRCIGHLHDHETARLLCSVLTSYGRES